eukprot:m.69039 g.69039  ORF g.69039 m.69039 type:complete len:645 (-) comp8262_c2_seq1:402-2336(-)
MDGEHSIVANVDDGAMGREMISDIEERVWNGFHTAFTSLGYSVELSEEKRLAHLICKVMGNKNRVYHLTPHVFDLFTSAETQPIACLAAMFHDTVYLTVDNTLEEEAMGLLEDAGVVLVGEEEGKTHDQPLVVFEIREIKEVKRRPGGLDYMIMDQARVIDPKHSIAVGLCCKLFAWDHSKPLRAGGLGVNEFLSAVLAFQSLIHLLTFQQLFQIVVCIEATIPFRNPTVYSDLLKRVISTAQETPGLKEGITETQLVKFVARACILAERDVGNFASTDSRYFLEKAWELLPEINVSLRHPSQYTMLDYARAMLGMVKFYEFLLPSPERVFPQMDAARSIAEHQRLISLTTRNLNIGIEYCRTKFVAACIVAALVKNMSGDADVKLPVAFYCGRGRGIDILSHIQVSSRSSSMSSDDDELTINLGKTLPTSALRRATSIQPSQTNDQNGGDISDKDVETYSSFMLMERAAKSKPIPRISNRMERRRSSIPAPQGSNDNLVDMLGRMSSNSSVTSTDMLTRLDMPKKDPLLPTVSEYFFVDLLVSAYEYVDTLLLHGSGYSSAFDTSQDRTSFHIHHTLGREGGLDAAYRMSVEYIAEDIDDDEYLLQFTEDVIEPLKSALETRNGLSGGKKRSKSVGIINVSLQ